MKKILITGNSGYIGSHLTKWLKDRNYIVHGLDIKDPIIPVDKFYKIDINKIIKLEEEIEPYDAVIHLAALVNVGQSEQVPILYYVTNLNGTMNVIAKIPTKNFIFASTGAAALCESAYGISKRGAEDVVREFCTLHTKTDYTIFRFYNVIGSTVVPPTNPDGLMYNLMKSKETGEFTIFGNDYDTEDGTCIRDYVHVEEICNSLELAIHESSNSVESLGHGLGYSVKEMVELFQFVNKTSINVKYGPRRKGDAAISVLDNVSPYMKFQYKLTDLLKV